MEMDKALLMEAIGIVRKRAAFYDDLGETEKACAYYNAATIFQAAVDGAVEVLPQFLKGLTF